MTAALNWSTAELDLPALADSGYESTGHGIKTPTKQPADGTPLAVENRHVDDYAKRARLPRAAQNLPQS